MFGRDSGDTHVLCPYDDTHLILAKSFNSHLIRCRKNNTHHKKVPCKFDRTHMVPKPELQHHHANCPSRLYLDRKMQVIVEGSDALKGDVSGPPIQSSYVNDHEEDWDAAPKYRATNALFSAKTEEDEEDGYDPVGAVALVARGMYANRAGIEEEETFRRVPLAPSKAAQLSAQVAPRPQGSSSQIYEFSVQQAMLGRGRGKPSGPGTQVGAHTGTVTQALESVGRGRGVAQVSTNGTTGSNPPSVGRGIVRYATRTTPVQQNQASVYNQQVTTSGCLSQFDDSEDVQAQSGGTSTTQKLTGSAPSYAQQASTTLHGDMALMNSLDLKALLLAEQQESEREMEELQQRQQQRRQQLLEAVRLKQQLPPQQQLKQQQHSHLDAPPGLRVNEKLDFSDMNPQELVKERRKLEKKLKQVSALENKAADGNSLSTEEAAKVRKKTRILQDLEKITQFL